MPKKGSKLIVKMASHPTDEECMLFYTEYVDNRHNSNVQNMVKHYFFLVDTSGSMGGSKIVAVKKALISLFSKLPSGSDFTVITFDDEAKAILVNIKSDHVTDQNKREIENLVIGGSTYLEKALRLCAYQSHNLNPAEPCSIIILTDGLDSSKMTAEEMIKIVNKCWKKDCPPPYIGPIGIGENYSVNFLTQLGKRTNTLVHINGPKDVWEKLNDMCALMNQVRGSDVTISCYQDEKPYCITNFGALVPEKPIMSCTKVPRPVNDNYAFTISVNDEFSMDTTLAPNKKDINPVLTIYARDLYLEICSQDIPLKERREKLEPILSWLPDDDTKYFPLFPQLTCRYLRKEIVKTIQASRELDVRYTITTVRDNATRPLLNKPQKCFYVINDGNQAHHIPLGEYKIIGRKVDTTTDITWKAVLKDEGISISRKHTIIEANSDGSSLTISDQSHRDLCTFVCYDLAKNTWHKLQGDLNNISSLTISVDQIDSNAGVVAIKLNNELDNPSTLFTLLLTEKDKQLSKQEHDKMWESILAKFTAFIGEKKKQEDKDVVIKSQDLTIPSIATTNFGTFSNIHKDDKGWVALKKAQLTNVEKTDIEEMLMSLKPTTKTPTVDLLAGVSAVYRDEPSKDTTRRDELVLIIMDLVSLIRQESHRPQKQLDLIIERLSFYVDYLEGLTNVLICENLLRDDFCKEGCVAEDEFRNIIRLATAIADNRASKEMLNRIALSTWVKDDYDKVKDIIRKQKAECQEKTVTIGSTISFLKILEECIVQPITKGQCVDLNDLQQKFNNKKITSAELACLHQILIQLGAFNDKMNNSIINVQAANYFRDNFFSLPTKDMSVNLMDSQVMSAFANTSTITRSLI